MFLRWLIALSLLVASMSAAVRYDMTKEELLRELGKPTSVLAKGGREILIYSNNVRIELDQGKIVSLKGIVAVDDAASNPPAASVDPQAAPAQSESAAAPAQQQAQATTGAKSEKETDEADTETERALAQLEDFDSQASDESSPSFAILDFLVELFVKWLLILAALKLTAKYWNADIEWKGLMIAAGADTAVRAVVLGIGEGLLGMFSVFYADEALAAIVLVLVLRKVSTNQSLPQAVTITLTSKVFSIVVGSFLSVFILRSLH